ncbi:MAG: hypothetical protein WCO77_02080 [bacterium]
MSKLSAVCVAVVFMALGMWVLTGCDSAEGVDGVGVSPAAVTLGGSATNATTAVVFTAQVKDALALPLEWSVSSPALGIIISHSGSNATYKANAATGENIVTVRDQYGNEGSAVVTQE